MRIKKTSNAFPKTSHTVNVPSDSQVDTYSCDYINDRNIYSTSEVDTGKKWIDNKTIYRKVVNFGALPSSTTAKNVAHNISNVDTFTLIYGLVKSSNNTLPIPYATTDANSNIRLLANTTNVQIGVGYDRSSETAYVILEYTKSS